MKLVRDTPLMAAYRVFSVRPPRPSLTVVIKGSFVPQQDAPVLFAEAQEPPRGELFFDDEIENSLRSPSDMALLKPVGEAMLVGKAYTPSGRPMKALRCAFQVGPIKKRFAVFGDRAWEGSRVAPRLGDPLPFTEMPLCFERSYGGPGFAKNPHGRGRAPVAGPEGERLLLPNLEDPDRLIDSPSAAPDPIATFPLHPLSEARTRHAGSYGEAYMRERWPYLPEDFRWEYFLEAPEDQRLIGAFFEGDERVGLLGLDRELPELRTQLPGLLPRVFLEIREEGKEKASFVELPVRLDTVTLDTEARRIFLCWRGLVEVPSEGLEEVKHLFVTHEPLAKKSSAEAMRERFLSCLEEEAAEERRAEGEAPLEEKKTDYFSRSEEEEAEKWTRFVLPKSGAAGASEGAEEKGTMVFSPGEEEGRATRAFVPARDLLSAAQVEEAGEEEALREAQQEAQLEALDAELKAQLAGLRAPVQAESPPAGETEPPDPREMGAAFAALGLSPPAGLLDSLASSEEIPSEEEPAEEEELFEAPEDDEPTAAFRPGLHGLGPRPPSEESPYDPEVRAALLRKLEAGEPLVDLDLSEGDLHGLDLSGKDLSGSILRGASLRGARLSGARLLGAVLAGADLRGADLSGAQLARADLVACQAQEVSFAGAELTEADLSEAQLTGARFSGARGGATRMVGAQLDGADLSSAALPEADFSEASLNGAIFREAHLGRAYFERAEAEAVVFERSDLRGARGEGLKAPKAQMRAVLGDDSHWERADLREADLSFSSLPRADFSEAQLGGAGLDACVLRRAYLDGASLARARLRRADLFEARLASADLRGADLSSANLFAAELWRARTEGAVLDHAELGRTHLEREESSS